MRVFLMSCLAVVVLAVCGYFAMSMAQRASGTTFATEGARIKQSWSYRKMAKRPGPQTVGNVIPEGDAGEDCSVATTWKWIAIDFGDAAEENPTCT